MVVPDFKTNPSVRKLWCCQSIPKKKKSWGSWSHHVLQRIKIESGDPVSKGFWFCDLLEVWLEEWDMRGKPVCAQKTLCTLCMHAYKHIYIYVYIYYYKSIYIYILYFIIYIYNLIAARTVPIRAACFVMHQTSAVWCATVCLTDSSEKESDLSFKWNTPMATSFPGFHGIHIQGLVGHGERKTAWE